MGKMIDMSGQKFGRLTVVSPAGRRKNTRSISWKCICDCGNEVIADGYLVRKGETSSCGCLQKDRAGEFNTVDITGQSFGRLTVLSQAKSNKYGDARWNCVCACGKKTTVVGYRLRNGKRTSCGCNLLPGPTHHAWKEDTSPEKRRMHRIINRYQKFRKQVIKRDDCVCLVCNKKYKPEEVEAHHLNAFDEHNKENDKKENGVTLCWSHHKAFHRVYPNTKCTRQQFVDWLLDNGKIEAVSHMPNSSPKGIIN